MERRKIYPPTPGIEPGPFNLEASTLPLELPGPLVVHIIIIIIIIKVFGPSAGLSLQTQEARLQFCPKVAVLL